VSGRKERCNASQDAPDAGDAENTSLASVRNTARSDTGSIFANVHHRSLCQLSL